MLFRSPTQIPYLQKSLSDQLKISVNSSIDPLTVVSKGACQYGKSQRIHEQFIDRETELDKSSKKISLNYSPLTSLTEESISGKIFGLEDKNQYHIQIQSDDGMFLGPKMKISNGKFFYLINIVAVQYVMPSSLIP